MLERTEAVVREVGGIGDDFAVMFVTSGATQHFAMVPANFLGAGDTADYCHTGVWSGKAMEEARRVGTVHVACSGEPAFDAVPTAFTSAPLDPTVAQNIAVPGTTARVSPIILSGKAIFSATVM